MLITEFNNDIILNILYESLKCTISKINNEVVFQDN